MYLKNNWHHKLSSDTPPKFKNWLEKPYVISKAMKLLCNDLTVKVISQKEEYITKQEQSFLNLLNNHSFVRKISLNGNNYPWEYARVVVPNKTYHEYIECFKNLGGKLIGENLLYNNPNTTRGNFEFCCMDKSNYVFKEIVKHLNNFNNKAKLIWGRRSIFYIDGEYPLLISEYFLPDIPDYPREDTQNAYREHSL